MTIGSAGILVESSDGVWSVVFAPPPPLPEPEEDVKPDFAIGDDNGS